MKLPEPDVAIVAKRSSSDSSRTQLQSWELWVQGDMEAVLQGEEEREALVDSLTQQLTQQHLQLTAMEQEVVSAADVAQVRLAILFFSFRFISQMHSKNTVLSGSSRYATCHASNGD